MKPHTFTLILLSLILVHSASGQEGIWCKTEKDCTLCEPGLEICLDGHCICAVAKEAAAATALKGVNKVANVKAQAEETFFRYVQEECTSPSDCDCLHGIICMRGSCYCASSAAAALKGDKIYRQPVCPSPSDCECTGDIICMEGICYCAPPAAAAAASQGDEKVGGAKAEA